MRLPELLLNILLLTINSTKGFVLEGEVGGWCFMKISFERVIRLWSVFDAHSFFSILVSCSVSEIKISLFLSVNFYGILFVRVIQKFDGDGMMALY